MHLRTPLRVAAATLAAAALLAGCDDDRVRVAFDPAAGTTYEYRYEVASTTTRVLADDEPERTERASVILAEHRVLEGDGDGVRVEVELRRDDEAARSYVVRFDRGAQLSAIELIEGVELGTLGQGGVGEVLGAPVGAPPDPLRPGEAWEIDREVSLPGDPLPVRLTGTGRLLALDVVDGTEVATVETTVALPVAGRTDDERTTIAGRQETTTRVSYDLRDGSVVEATSRTTGVLDLDIQPPLGVLGPPVAGSLTYVIDTETERRAAQRPG